MPTLRAVSDRMVQADEETLGRYFIYANPSPPPALPPRPPRRRNQQPSDDEANEPPAPTEPVVPTLLFTENDTNFARLYGGQNVTPYTKDAFHDHVVPSHRPPKPLPVQSDPSLNPNSNAPDADALAKHLEGALEGPPEGHGSPALDSGAATPTANGVDEPDAPVDEPDERVFVNPARAGTKMGAHYVFKDVPARGGCAVVRIKLTPRKASEDPAARDDEAFDATIEARREDADEFYLRFNSSALSDDMRNIMRQALAGMLWSKQFYQFIHSAWSHGDAGQPAPPPERKYVRNQNWRHLHIDNILSMPDKWECASSLSRV